MPEMLLINPRRRRRAKSAKRRHRRGARKMSALQRKYFGGGRKRRASPRRSVRRSRGRRRLRANPVGSYLPMAENPRRRRRSRRASARRSRRRGYRRNPISSSGFAGRVTIFNGTVNLAVNSLVGAAGGIGVDAIMGQASKYLPPNLASEMDLNGQLNYPYLGIKAGVAVLLGVVGARFLPGRFKDLAARAAAGSLTIQTYQFLRPLAAPHIPLGGLGYYNPAQIARPRGRVGAYLPRNRLRGATYPAVVGSGVSNFEGYVL